MSNGMYFQVHLTDDCNLNCLHCYHEREKKTVYLNPEQFDHILADVMRYLNSQGMVPGRAVFCGGEPTLSPILLESIRKCRQAGFPSAAVLTNGTLITEEFAKELVSAGCTSVQICIEGNWETHNLIRNGTFDQVLEAWEICRKNGLKVKNQTTLNKINYKQVQEIVEICTGRTDTTAFLRQVPHNREIDILTPAQWLEVLKDLFLSSLQQGNELSNFVRMRDIHWLHLFCNATYRCGLKQPYLSSIAVESNGDVYSCRKSGIVIGNIFREGLSEINRDSPVLKRARNRENLNDQCRNCSRVDVCGSCPAMARALTGDFMAKDPQCVLSELPEDFWLEILRVTEDLPPQDTENHVAVNVAEVVNHMKISGTYGLALMEVQTRKIASTAARERGLSVSGEELQQAADTFRRAKGLTGGVDTVLWFKKHRVSLAAFEEFLETSLLVSKLKEQIKEEAGTEKYAYPKVSELLQELTFREWLTKTVAQA